MWSWQLFNFLSHVEIYGDFTEAYRIVIAYTEIEIHIIKQEHVFSGYKPYLSDRVTYYTNANGDSLVHPDGN